MKDKGPLHLALRAREGAVVVVSIPAVVVVAIGWWRVVVVVVVVGVAVSPCRDDVAVSTCDPPCEQWLAVVGAGAGSSFVVTYRVGLLVMTWRH
jgi:hypothetical protein